MFYKQGCCFRYVYTYRGKLQSARVLLEDEKNWCKNALKTHFPFV